MFEPGKVFLNGYLLTLNAGLEVVPIPGPSLSYVLPNRHLINEEIGLTTTYSMRLCTDMCGTCTPIEKFDICPDLPLRRHIRISTARLKRLDRRVDLMIYRSATGVWASLPSWRRSPMEPLTRLDVLDTRFETFGLNLP